jgi:DNA-binding MarR family transcriptional regulator
VQASTASAQAKGGSAELTATLASILTHLLTSTGRDFFKAVDELELSLTQIKALRALIDAGEPLSMGAMSEQLGLSLPAISRAVDGLVRREFVTREEDPHDRRSKRLALTRKGHRTHDQLYALRVAGIRAFVEELEPDERDALAAGLAPIARRAGKEPVR